MKKLHKIFHPKVSIAGVGSYTPSLRMTSEEIEAKIRNESVFHDFEKDTIFQISGTSTRYFALPHEDASTLAFEAAKEAIDNASLTIGDIDCIIFASASQDMIEPATANRVQHLLSSTAPVFDVKNACNSFLNGLEVGKSLIVSGQYKNILVCSGETPSRAIRWSTNNREAFKDALAGYSLSDAGVAMVLTIRKKDAPELVFTEFFSQGAYFDASTIAGGGSAFPREIDKLFFRSDSRRLAEAFQDEKIHTFTNSVLKSHSWKLKDISYFLPHIVSRYSLEVFLKQFPIAHHQILNHNTTHGNMASCSVPFSFIDGIKRSKFSHGEKILMIGLGAGATYGLVGIEY